jgi:hypothetical protein
MLSKPFCSTISGCFHWSRTQSLLLFIVLFLIITAASVRSHGRACFQSHTTDASGQRERKKKRERAREREIDRERDTYRERERQRQRQRQTQRERQRERHIPRETETETERDTERHRETQRETQRERRRDFVDQSKSRQAKLVRSLNRPGCNARWPRLSHVAVTIYSPAEQSTCLVR